MVRSKTMILLWALLLLSGCAGIGPRTVDRDRFDYTTAISDSWKHQMLFQPGQNTLWGCPGFPGRFFGDQPVPDCGADQSGRNP